MALEKPIEQATGVVVNYHRITSYVVNFITMETTVGWSSYVDEKTRRSNKDPISKSAVTWSEVPEIKGDCRAWGYVALKKRPEWKDAKDV